MDKRRNAIHRILRAWLRLYASMRHLRRRLRRSHGLTDDSLMLLRVLVEAEPLSIGDLAELTGYHVATLGQMLERMEDDGLLQRERDPEDRRRVLLQTTARGRELAASASQFGPWRIGALAAKLSDEQLDELSRGFEWLSSLLSPPPPTSSDDRSEEDDSMHCDTHQGFGKRIHIEFGPQGFDFQKFFGGVFPGFGFARRFRSRRERLEKLETYLAELKAEVEAVQEEIRELNRNPGPAGPDLDPDPGPTPSV